MLQESFSLFEKAIIIQALPTSKNLGERIRNRYDFYESYAFLMDGTGEIFVSFYDGIAQSTTNYMQKEVVMVVKAAVMAFFQATFLLFAAACFTTRPALAEGSSLPIPVRIEKLDSAKVGESREFWVSLPDQYTESDEKYPVIYMMDGDFNFNSGGIGGLRHAAQMGEIPEFIIVGIKNTDRSQDIFPEEVTYGDGSKAGGRADPYLDFIRAELIPHIEKNYRSENFRVLYGTSNTGFTVVHALFRDPGLANVFVAASATLRVPCFMSKRDQLIRDFKGGKRNLVLVMGEHDLPTVLSQNGELKEKIDVGAPAELTCRFVVIGNGGHVPANALLEGLRLHFESWKISRPLSEKNFAETRAQVDRRLEKYGIQGRLPEESLKELGEGLLGEKKYVKAIEVLQYRVENYPGSADARVSLGDGYLGSGDRDKGRECFNQALTLAPGHAAATARLKELDKK
jgi:predicted alpha/beta superfamily hydrolase